jgi:hypothetical protein
MEQDQQQEEEIEVNFRLDQAGRTARQSSASNHEEQEGDANTTRTSSTIRYEPHSVMAQLHVVVGDQATRTTSTSPATTTTILQVEPSSALLDELLFDCEISDCGLMPRTFWVPSNGFQPRCSLEQMALDVFRYHAGSTSTSTSTSTTIQYDEETSGAEWWVQIRPSPEKVGRYAMHKEPEEDETATTKDMTKEGISFHWDKDEDLRILCGGNIYVHPHISTVTYLTSIGAPTLALNIRINNLTGEWIVPSSSNENEHVQGFLSWPRFGKHLSFDGRYLHAAPSDLMEKGAFEKQCHIPVDNPTPDDQKKLKRRYRRVTFLVNVWLNHKPFGIKPFPDTMIDKLSGHATDQARVGLHFSNNYKPTTKSVTVDSKGVAKDGSDQGSATDGMITRFQWPMGDCSSGEVIEADIPLDVVLGQASDGGSLGVTWTEPSGVMLSVVTTKNASTEEADSILQENGKPAKQPRLT